MLLDAQPTLQPDAARVHDCTRDRMGRRQLLTGAAALAVIGPAAAQAGGVSSGWDDIQRSGRGQQVMFHASGNDERTNAFVTWAGGRVRSLFDIDLRHVKLRDPSEAVARIAADKAAGKTVGGSADLICADGSTLLAMRQTGLLDGPVLELLPGAGLIARDDKPSTVLDRMVPMDGYAIPWRLAQIVFIHDAATNPDPPRTIPALLGWARAHPGRFTHLSPQDPLGVAFLEQALCELVAEPEKLRRPVSPAAFTKAAAPLWEWYDQLRPLLWQDGKTFPASLAVQRDLMKAGEIDLIMSFNPSEAVISIAAGALQPTAQAFVLEHGDIGHCIYLAVPFNAAHRAGALLVANFLLSPEAQARDSDPRFCGFPTVLAMDRLSPDDYVYFDEVPRLPDLLSDAERGLPLPEPHVSWINLTVAAWEKRHSA